MKKIFAMALALCMIFALCAVPAHAEATEISLWTYPIGKWGTQADVDALIKAFNEAYPDIKVNVEYLTYSDGDDKVNTAIEGNAAPDIVMEGPERLVANWGAKGKMVALNDLWTDEAKADIYASVEAACHDADGNYYEYPLCMTAHCMAINKTVFEAAGAMQYIDAENHTWTTEGFLAAVKAVYDAGYENVGVVFCGGQGGDQGNRALINNMYGGTFTNPEHTAYTADSEENIKALETLYATEGISFDPSIVGGDEINLFRQGIFQMATCWNIAQQLNTDNNDAGLTNNGDEILFMAFPSPNGSDTQLCGGIWGFGVFDNGNDAKVEAAKTFIKWACDEEAAMNVKASTYFPVKASVVDVYAGEASETVMNEYTKLMPFLGDYYQIVPGWAVARTEWWNMLQRIGNGGNVADEVAVFVANANAAAQG